MIAVGGTSGREHSSESRDLPLSILRGGGKLRARGAGFQWFLQPLGCGAISVKSPLTEPDQASTVSLPFVAGWSSLVARQAHNLKVAGSNPAPAPNLKPSETLPRVSF